MNSIIHNNKKLISICADDFGITEKVSNAILNLARLRCVSEISCIVVTDTFDKIKIQENLKDNVDFGLHITLTNLKPLSKLNYIVNNNNRFYNLNKLLLMTLIHPKIKDEIKNEIYMQFDQFVKVMDFLPKFIDGHHHVHQFPLVSKIILELINDKYKKSDFKPWVRISNDNLLNILIRRTNISKAFIIKLFSYNISKLCKINNIKTNNGFSGFYNFSKKYRYADLFEAFLKGVKDGHLIMVHPGISDVNLLNFDNVTKTRDKEYAFFLSDKFRKILNIHNVKIIRQSILHSA